MVAAMAGPLQLCLWFLHSIPPHDVHNVLVSNVNSCKWAEPLVLAHLRQVLQEHPQLAQLLLDALQLRLQLPILLLQLRQAGGLLCTRPSCRFPVIGLPAGNRSVIIMEPGLVGETCGVNPALGDIVVCFIYSVVLDQLCMQEPRSRAIDASWIDNL